jgi:hypothetical protein
MYNDIYIQAGPLPGVKSIGIPNKTNICLTHAVDAGNPDLIPDLIAFYFEGNPVFSFNICIRNLETDPEVLNKLVVLLSHPLYKRTEKGIKLFILENSPAGKCFGMADEFLKKQGYQKRDLVQIPANLAENGIPGAILVSENCREFQTGKEGFQQAYLTYLQQNYKAEDTFFLKSDTVFPLGNVINTIIEAEADFKNSFPYLAGVLQELYRLKQQNNRLYSSEAMLKNELGILNSLFESNAKNNEIAYILNFYQKEYEVLPLWFKRLGHIVKFLAGKRSFSSFFKD